MQYKVLFFLKKIIIICFLSLLVGSVNFVTAQKKCKFDSEKVDPITGKEVKSIKTSVLKNSPISGGSYWHIYFDREGDSFSARTSIKLLGDYNMYLVQNDSIILKLENNKIVTIYALESSAPISGGYVNSANQPVFTATYNAKYAITKEQLEQLAESPVVFVRINIKDQVFDKKFPKGESKSLITGVKCLLQ